jgi:hypothetical protein
MHVIDTWLPVPPGHGKAMKLTWFGGTALRIHIGGEILVADPASAVGVDRAELTSGADRSFEMGGDLRTVDPLRWQPRRPVAVIEEEAGPAGVLVHRMGPQAVLVEAIGEPPLILLGGAPPQAGRWAGDAVVVVYGETAARRALDVLRPRLIAMALPEAAVEPVIAGLRDQLAGTALVALEPGLALEV